MCRPSRPLQISENPALQEVQLSPDAELMYTTLFLAEARKHARLLALINAGTPVMRGRAHTTVAAVPVEEPARKDEVEPRPRRLSA